MINVLYDIGFFLLLKDFEVALQTKPTYNVAALWLIHWKFSTDN